MNEKEEIYKQKVWEFLDGIKPDEHYTINNLCIPGNRELFIRSVKMYMDAHPWQGWLSFNKDYTKFYKVWPVEFKEEPPLSLIRHPRQTGSSGHPESSIPA